MDVCADQAYVCQRQTESATVVCYHLSVIYLLTSFTARVLLSASPGLSFWRSLLNRIGQGPTLITLCGVADSRC